jgi:hypothetical protein
MVNPKPANSVSPPNRKTTHIPTIKFRTSTTKDDRVYVINRAYLLPPKNFAEFKKPLKRSTSFQYKKLIKIIMKTPII